MTRLLIFCGFWISGLHGLLSDARAFSLTSLLPLARPISSSLREVSTWCFREQIARSKKTPALQAIALIPSRLIRQMLANFFEVQFCITAQAKKKRFVVLCSRPRQHVLSRCSSATTAKKCTKKLDARAKLLFANLNFMGFCRSRCCYRCLSSLGDSETWSWGTIFSLRMITQASWILQLVII